MGGSAAYFPATRHPWSCVVFVLPLLLVYEVGLYLAGPEQPDLLRNGADAWVRLGLAHCGLKATYWAPTLLIAIFVLWSALRRGDRPVNLFSIWSGMAVESAIYALGLWALSRALWPVLDGLGIKLSVDTVNLRLTPENFRQIISFVGAGIYEETLFRLLIFSALYWGLSFADFPPLLSGILAAIGSALLFAAAHNMGPNGEAFNGYVFLFRNLAGLYFTALYRFRGFGIAVGAHAGYDVLVGVMIPHG